MSGDATPAGAAVRIPLAGDTARACLVGLFAGAVAFAWFAIIALARWDLGRTTSYDLGIFSQGAQQWSIGHLPSSFIRGPHTLLADHFSPITAVFGVAWRIWPDPRALLLTQGLCLAIAVGVVAGIAAIRIGTWAGFAVLLLGAAGRALVAGDLFDVHEVCFAAPLMALLVWAMLWHRLRWVVVACVLLLTVKEDLGLTVIAAGALWWWRGWWHARGRDGERRARREGLVLSGLGVVGLIVAVGVIAHFNPGGSSSYLTYFGAGGGDELIGSSAAPVNGLDLLGRAGPLVFFTAACLVIGWRSNLTWLAIPTLAWRTFSSNPHYWSSRYHYAVDLVPIALGAAIEAWPYAVAWWHARRWATPCAIVVALASAGLTVGGGVASLTRQQISPLAAFHTSARVRDLQRASAQIPDGARVAAQNNLGPYLIADHRVTMLGSGRPEHVSYAVFTLGDVSQFQATPCQRTTYLRLAREPQRHWRLTRIGSVLLVTFPTPRPAAFPSCDQDRSSGQ
ncbi:DUF2079 domain-containing protein [Leekyejoonella antrihumi]|uniref:DUF2079 domain-containing protein n=1 Tax=Leekyejoonella antrihumi TaxID=1660198 RepID=A0A563E8L2_9MICO|nr:DUF2079 domain-containing protein [Leekyejoonella antrihumi]TWP38154.1 DUF2079 domain-containing protein [Leekyejoonella antrihumi]